MKRRKAGRGKGIGTRRMKGSETKGNKRKKEEEKKKKNEK